MTRPHSRLHVPKYPCPQSTSDRKETSFAVALKKPPSIARVIWAGFKFLLGSREKSFVANRVEAELFARERFALLLREPFNTESDKEIARSWAPHLGTSERTVENWLACTHSASITDMTIVGATHGIWQTAAIFVGEDTRAQVLNRIGRR
jgi:hypothetical protein